MRKNITLDIIGRLRERVPEIAYYDLWNDQIATLAGGAVFARPALFVEFETIEWRQMQHGSRRGDVRLRLHVVTDAVSANGACDKRFEASLAHFDLLRRVCGALHGMHGEGYAGMMHTTSATNHSHAELIESIEYFVTSAVEHLGQ